MRKQKGMTQLELAEKMGVTDKAVSKWGRALSCPDIASLPTLAGSLGVLVDELLQVKNGKSPAPVGDVARIADTVLKGVALAMGVAAAVLAAMEQLDQKSAAIMLGTGLACAAATLLKEQKQ
ncbi:MAG: helix-turn-helix transcriptional regulator [Oscillospiraceae bacterium]|nr:helix-turn-helix transcriptional regulator [Oscillospiraceae bacterium]